MEKKSTTPIEYMSIGTIAKRMGTTVRTLQHYDAIGLLSPSSESDGGRRLYTYKDMILFHQIQSLKSLGFSLDDIKNKLVSLDTPEEVASVLSDQALAIQEKIEQLTSSLHAVEILKKEVLQMQKVDFEKYADIIVNLQMNNDYYWIIKHFDHDTLDHIRHQFDEESGLLFMNQFNELIDNIIVLQEQNISPQDKITQDTAKVFWDMVMEFTNGDMNMLKGLMEFEHRLVHEAKDVNEWKEKMAQVITYMEPAMELYFETMGVNPFEVEQ